MAFEQNQELVNKQITSDLKQTSLLGILNPPEQPGKEPSDIAKFRELFGIKEPIHVGDGSSPKYRYEVRGPYEIPVRSKNPKTIDPEDIHSFWEKRKTSGRSELENSIGVYVLAIQHGQSMNPWYIGMATNATFRKTCFVENDLERINQELAARRGKPLAYFLPLFTPTGRLAKASEKDGPVRKNTVFVKDWLFRFGAKQAKHLFSQNEEDRKKNRALEVRGLTHLGKGRPSLETETLRKLLGIEG